MQLDVDNSGQKGRMTPALKKGYSAIYYCLGLDQIIPNLKIIDIPKNQTMTRTIFPNLESESKIILQQVSNLVSTGNFRSEPKFESFHLGDPNSKVL